MVPLNYGTQLVTRDEWGARPPTSVQHLAAGEVTSHWEGPNMGEFPHETCASRVRGIQNYHMDTKEWTDIAYNAVVCPHGYVFEGRGPGVRSAANGTNAGNNGAYAACYLGGEGDPFTEPGKRGMKAGGDWLTFAGSARNGHRDWKATACPGDDIYNWTHAGQPVAWPPEEDTLSAAEVADIKAHVTAEANDSRPFFAHDYTLDSSQGPWVVFKQAGIKKWVQTHEQGVAYLQDRVFCKSVFANGFPEAWPRTKAELNLYETVGPVPPGWE